MSDSTKSQAAPIEEKSIFDDFEADFNQKKSETMSLGDYLDLCKGDKMAYANAPERLLDAIGKPEIIDTANEKGEMGRIFQGRTIARYPAFSDFFGAEETIEKIVSHLKGAAAGTEYRKQVLYLLGPVGGGKSSLGDRVKELMEERPIYVLKAKDRDGIKGEMSPVLETPLGLFSAPNMRARVESKYGVPERYMKTTLSPWAVKRLNEAKGNINEAFEVVKVYPSYQNQIAIAKVEPGDENNQDTSVLVGKVDINKLGEGLPQNDTDTYLYSGGFASGNQGVMEFVEMFKAPLKVLNPMLEALQSGNYQGTENVGAIPFTGIVFAHSNESEWKAFAGDRKNEAILDRINVIHVPYTMRMTEEAKIYQKMLDQSGFSDLPVAPRTIDLLAKFSVMSRLSDAEGVAKYDPSIRAQVYDGKIPEDVKANVPTIGELRKYAPLDEGMSGISTRFAFKALTETFNKNANQGEHAADPVLLMEVLEDRVKKDGRIPDADKERLIGLIANHLMPEYAKFIKEEITAAYTGASDEMCQSMFDRYVNMAEAWLHNEDFNDKGVTGDVLTKDEVDKKLKEIEQPAGIHSGKDFRNEVVMYVRRQEAKSHSQVEWSSYKKLADVIRKNLSKKMADVMPVIKFDGAADAKMAQKRDAFIESMQEKGYTMPMIKRAVGVYEKTLG